MADFTEPTKSVSISELRFLSLVAIGNQARAAALELVRFNLRIEILIIGSLTAGCQ